MLSTFHGKANIPSGASAVFRAKLVSQQLGAREHELQVALQKQERYQQAVQDVTLKMERTQSKLARTYPSSLADLDKQLKDYKVRNFFRKQC